MKKRNKSMKRTATAVAAAAAAAAPLTFAAPAFASTEFPIPIPSAPEEPHAVSDVPNLTLSANSYRTFTLNGGEYSLAQTSGGSAVKATLFELGGGDYSVLNIETLSVGTATFAIRQGETEVDAFTVNVIDAGADGRIDIEDVIRFTKLQPELADTSEKIKALLGGIEHREANKPPMPKMEGNNFPFLQAPFPLPIGSPGSFSLASMFVDPEKDSLTFSKIPMPEGEEPGGGLYQYVTIHPTTGVVTVNVPRGAIDGVGTFLVEIKDSRGAAVAVPVLVSLYDKDLFWDASWYGEGRVILYENITYLKFLLGFTYDDFVDVDADISDVVPEAVRNLISAEVLPGESEYDLELEIVGDENLTAEMIPDELPLSLTFSQVVGEDVVRTVTLPFTLRKNTAPTALHEYLETPYEIQLSAEEAASGLFNRPLNLSDLFEDPDAASWDRLTFESELLYASPELSPAEGIIIDEETGQFTFHYDDEDQTAEYLITATDSAGESATVYVQSFTNRAPEVVNPLPYDFHAVNLDEYNTVTLNDGVTFADDRYDDLEFTLSPSDAVDPLIPSISTLGSGTIALTLNAEPTDITSTVNFNVIAEDGSGRKATKPMRVIAPEDITVVAEDDSTLDLDALFRKPESHTYTYSIIRDENESSFASIDGHLLSFSDVGAENDRVTISASKDGATVKDIRLTVQEEINAYDSVLFNPVEPSVTGDVYEMAIDLSEVFDDMTDGFATDEYFYYMEPSVPYEYEDFEVVFHPVDKLAYVRYPYHELLYGTLSIARYRNGEYEVANFEIGNFGY